MVRGKAGSDLAGKDVICESSPGRDDSVKIQTL